MGLDLNVVITEEDSKNYSRGISVCKGPVVKESIINTRLKKKAYVVQAER